MDVVFLKDWGTFAGAVVGAVVSVVTLIRSVRAGGDRIIVGSGSIPPTLSPGDELHVQNCSAHAVTIEDYGVILFKGSLLSIPWALETATLPDDFGGFTMKKLHLEPRDVACAGIEVPGRCAGVYANTIGHRPKLYFYRSVPMYRRAWLWLLIRLFRRHS